MPSVLRRQSGFPFLSYGFRSTNGKAIIAYWLAAHSVAGGRFPTFYSNFTLKGSGIHNPVLIDVVSGDIRPLHWKKNSTDTLEALPISDSIMAIADADYFDWPVLPEAPSSLTAHVAGGSVNLSWEVHSRNPQHIVVERREDSASGRASWSQIAELASSASHYTDSRTRKGQQISYRVRATNESGKSASSNIVRVTAP